MLDFQQRIALSRLAMFVSKDNFLPKVFGLKLNGRSVSLRLAPAISYFEDMNIPGADFCAVNQVRAMVMNYKLKEAKLLFPNYQSK